MPETNETAEQPQNKRRMAGIIRRLTNRGQTGPPAHLSLEPETTAQAVRSLAKAIENICRRDNYGAVSTISERVNYIWARIFDISKETAPQRKYEMAEELLNYPDIMTKLLIVLHLAEVDVKRKIVDLLYLLETWSSNDSPESCVPRRDETRNPPKFNELLYRCRFELFLILQEGRQGPESVALFNDVIRIFAKDNDCLMAIFNDVGLNPSGNQARSEGCVWQVFERLLEIEGPRGFHVYAAFFETVEILFGSNHSAVHVFIVNNFTRFMQTFHKLIAINNFFIQAKSLKFVYNVLTSQLNYDIRVKWMAEPTLIKSVCLAIQSQHKCVRKEAVTLLKLFVQNPENSDNVHQFIGLNRNVFIKYCLDTAPIYYYDGTKWDKKMDLMLADIAFRLLHWDYGKYGPVVKKEFEEYERHRKIYEGIQLENLITDCIPENAQNAPRTQHDINVISQRHPAALREKSLLGRVKN